MQAPISSWKALLRGEIALARRRLARVLRASRPPRGSGAINNAVHETRKSLKRVRGALRLLRTGLPRLAARKINAFLRDAGRAISPLRDREALRQTLAKLVPEKAVTTRRPHSPSLRSLATASRKLEAAQRDLDGLPWKEIDRELLLDGLKRLYRRGRQTWKNASKEPSNEKLHAWRKRTKDLDFALYLLGREGSPPQKLAARLAAHLGDDHDLALAQVPVSVRSDASSLLHRILHQRHRHQKKAFQIGKRLFSGELRE